MDRFGNLSASEQAAQLQHINRETDRLPRVVKELQIVHADFVLMLEECHTLERARVLTSALSTWKGVLAELNEQARQKVDTLS